MAEDRRTGEEKEPLRGEWTGGTLAGEEVRDGSVIKGRDNYVPPEAYTPDSLGVDRAQAPERAGSVAGNTTGAGTVVGKPGEREPEDAAEDLGPGDSVVQEIGGEARH